MSSVDIVMAAMMAAGLGYGIWCLLYLHPTPLDPPEIGTGQPSPGERDASSPAARLPGRPRQPRQRDAAASAED